MPRSDNFRASIYMLLAMGTFTLGDSITKYLLAGMNSGQYILLRGIFATMLISFLAWRQGALRKIPLERMTVLRVAGEALATLSYIYSLGNLSQAFCSAVFQATPLAVTLAAALFLKEKVGWQRWSCILLGFIGVLIIIRPGTDGAAGIAAITILLASVGFASLRDIATRRVPSGIPTLYLSTLTAAGITIIGGGLVFPLGGWQPVSMVSIFVIACAAILILVGYHFIILAMRVGEISFVSPFRYSSLLWAIGLSMAVFGEAPDIYTIIGSVLVVGSGIYMVYREHRLNKRDRNKSTLASIPTGIGPK